jgi:hypothetical protein
MAIIEKKLIWQPWYRRMNVYPGHAWYREAGSDPVIASGDRMIVILNTELFPDGKPAPEIHVVVDWTGGDQGRVEEAAARSPRSNSPDDW